MTWLTYVSYFFGGIFLGNAIPHFVSGTMGRAFQSPFAHPPGKGLSSALVNIGWEHSTSSSVTCSCFASGRSTFAIRGMPSPSAPVSS
jgi:hypothetical protein